MEKYPRALGLWHAKYTKLLVLLSCAQLSVSPNQLTDAIDSSHAGLGAQSEQRRR